jgi:hypothetical protein
VTGFEKYDGVGLAGLIRKKPPSRASTSRIPP